MNEGKAFDQMTPPLAVTDPQGLGAQAVHRRHLHKAGVSADGGPVWIEVNSPDEQAAAIADGWLLEKPNPNLDARPPTGPGEAPTHPRRR